jgi:hypothetical protein
VHLRPGEPRTQDGGDRTRAAAEVDDDRRPRRSQRGGLLHQELGPAAWDEHAGGHRDPEAAELRPAEHLLERLAGDPASHQRLQPVRRRRLGHEEPGLVLGEDASRGAEPADDGRVRRRRSCGHGASRKKKSDRTRGRPPS